MARKRKKNWAVFTRRKIEAQATIKTPRGWVKRHCAAHFTQGWRFPLQLRESVWSAWIKCDRPNVCSITTKEFLPLLKVLAFSSSFSNRALYSQMQRTGVECRAWITESSYLVGQVGQTQRCKFTASTGGKLGPESRGNVLPCLPLNVGWKWRLYGFQAGVKKSTRNTMIYQCFYSSVNY